MADPKNSESQRHIRESKVAGDRLRARIWENYEKAQTDFVARYDRNLEALAQKTPWVKISAAQLKRLWFDFNESKVVGDKKGLEEIAERVLDGIARLRASVDIREQTNPELLKLEKLYASIFGAPTAEDKLISINKAVGIIYERSDLAQMLVEGDPDDLATKDYVLGGDWDYMVVFSGSERSVYFDHNLMGRGISAWTEDMGQATKLSRENAEGWKDYWIARDADNSSRYSLQLVAPKRQLPDRNPMVESDEEFEDIDPDMPVNSKEFLLTLDQRGHERKAELDAINKWTKSGEWYIPYTGTGYEQDFYAEANYKYFKEKYPFLNAQDSRLGFDTGTFPDEDDTFEMYLSQIDQTEWESFVEDVTAAENGMCVDEDEAQKLEQAETDRYVEQDFLPDFRRELKELPDYQDSFIQFAISRVTAHQIWELMQQKEMWPESEGNGSVYLRAEKFVEGLDLDGFMSLFEGVPLKEQWEAEKKKFYASEHGKKFNNFLTAAVAEHPEAQHAYSFMTSEDIFILLKSLVPDSNFRNPDLPRWDQFEQRLSNKNVLTGWIVTFPIAKLDSHLRGEYTQRALAVVAQTAVEQLPTWKRPVLDHPELPLGEAVDPDAVDPRDYLNAVSAYWGIGHQYGARTVWYTGNPWDKWSFEIGDAKQFKSQEEAASFSKNFGPNWHVDIKPIRLPDLYQEAADPDAVDPKEYLGNLKRKYVARIDTKYVRVGTGEPVVRSIWYSDNPFGWWIHREKAKVFDDPAAMNEVYLSLPKQQRSKIIVEPAEIVSEARKRDSDLPPDEDIDYRSWFKHGGYDSGRELFSDADVRVFIPSTTHTLEKYGFTVRNGSHEEWDRIVEPGPFFIVIPTKGAPWVIRQWYEEIRELAKDGRQYTVFPDELVKTHSEGPKVGVVLAKYFKKHLKEDFDKYFKWMFQFGGLASVRGYLKNVKIGANTELDSAIGIAAALEGKLDLASKFWQYPRDLLSKEGAWIYYDDYNDLALLFKDDRHSNYREAAEKVFSYETHDWFDFIWGESYPPKEVTGYLTPEHYKQLREILIGRSILIDDEAVLLSRETLSQYTDRDIEDWLDNYEDYQDGGDLEEIAEALSTAAKRALETIYSDAYFKGYLSVVTDALSSEYKWVKVGGKDKLAFFVPWKSIREMLATYEENNNEPYQGALSDLPGDALKLEPSEEYHGSLSDDKQVVIDSISEQLGELEPKEAPRDPAQPELFKALPGMGKTVHVQVYSENYPNGATVMMKEGDWIQLKQNNPEKTSKEAWDAYAAEHNIQPKSPLGESGPDEIGAKEFIQRMPLRYVITNEWESPSGKFTDYWAERGGWANSIERAVYYPSYDEAKNEYDRMMAGDVTSQFRLETNIKPVYESNDPDALDASDYISSLKVDYVIAHRFTGWTDYWSKTGGGWTTIKFAARYPTREAAQKTFDEIFADMPTLDQKARDAAEKFLGTTWIEAAAPVEEVLPESIQEALLMEGYKFAVTLIPLPREMADFVITWGESNIPNEWLYTKEGDDTMGRELEPHITVKYGLTVNNVPEQLRDICATTRPFPIFFEKVSLFNTNPDYDVLKIDIESPWLHELNKRVKAAVPNEDKFPEYHPHCTLAYVKKGMADALVGTDIFAGGGRKPQFTAMGMLFKGASEDKDDPNRTKESLLFSTVKKPQMKEALDPDAVDARAYIQSLKRPFGISYVSQRSGNTLYFKSMENPKGLDYLINWTNNVAQAKAFSTQEEAQQLIDTNGERRRTVQARGSSEGVSDTEYNIVPLPVIQQEAGPDDVNPKDYLNQVPVDACKFCGQDFGWPLSIRRDYVDSHGEVISCLGHVDKSGTFDPDERVDSDLSGFDLGHDSDFCENCGRSLLYGNLAESDPDEVDARGYIQQMPLYYIVKGKMKPEFIDNLDGDALAQMSEIFYFDSAGGSRSEPHRMTYSRAQKVIEWVAQSNPWFDVEAIPAEDQSQMYWQGRRTPQEIGEAENPDEPDSRVLKSLPALYYIKLQGPTDLWWAGSYWTDFNNATSFVSRERAEAELADDEFGVKRWVLNNPDIGRAISIEPFFETQFERVSESVDPDVPDARVLKALPVRYYIKFESKFDGRPVIRWWNIYGDWERNIEEATPFTTAERANVEIGDQRESNMRIKAAYLPYTISVIPILSEAQIDPDAIEPKDYMQDVPVQYVIKKVRPSQRHKNASVGWFWNNQWGWRTNLIGASRFITRVEADDMIRERGLQGYAQVEPVINESAPTPFDGVPFPTETSQLIRFLRGKRPVPQML